MLDPRPEVPASSDGLQYKFGPFCLRPDGTLYRSLAAVPLPPKELAILRVLLSNAGQIVPSQELKRSAWGDVHVSAASLPRCVSSLRARLDSANCIRTVYKQGYRFNLPVKPDPAPNSSPSFNPSGRATQTANPDEGPSDWIERRVANPNALPRLAILPFTTGEGVPDYLGTGIAEQIMIGFSRNRKPAVEVMARDSVASLVARGLTAEEVGRSLGANLALAGAITALPLYFRLRAEMIRVSDGVQLWIEDFLVPRTLIAQADARLAKRVSARVQNTFDTPESTAQPVPSDPAPIVMPPDDVQRSQASALYMQACALWNTSKRAKMEEAIRGFRSALELDATLMPARIELMHSYLFYSTFGFMPPIEAAELARKQAEAVLMLSQNGQPIYAALGSIHFYHDRDFAAAANAFARAQYTGYDPRMLIYKARFAVAQQRFADAISLLRSGLELDSYSPVLYGRLMWTLHLAGDATAALDEAKRTVALFPNHPGVLIYSANIFAASSEDLSNQAHHELAAQAVTMASKLIEIAPNLDASYSALAYAYARQGKAAQARELLDRQRSQSRERFMLAGFHAPALLQLGKVEEALEDMRTADLQRSPWFFEQLLDPRLKPLHSRKEFQQLTSGLNRMIPVSVA
jgi:DNA-binding winged helix-turn-helix (wHTH) protein/tetratricopeptide (TPR) repeat protein